jgi:hypothetical protein
MNSTRFPSLVRNSASLDAQIWFQVVEGSTSPYDRDATQREIEWLREHYRRLGQAPRF